MSRLTLAVLAATFALHAQTNPSFDAASVKPIDPRDGTSSSSNAGEYIGSLQSLIRFAWGIEDYRITGGPKWLDTDKFAVVYRPIGPKANLMLRTLLAERFKLTVHMETKELPVCTLVVAKNGPKMEQTAQPGGTAGGRGMIRGTMDMAQLTSALASTLDRQVVDKTGLTGLWKLSIKWTPDNQPAADTTGPSLVTAIQEQLGLRLESTKGPVEILAIDHAEKPTAN